MLPGRDPSAVPMLWRDKSADTQVAAIQAAKVQAKRLWTVQAGGVV
jgi:hypothetical protein